VSNKLLTYSHTYAYCTYRMNGWQTTIDGDGDRLSEQSTGNERSKDVVVNVGHSDPHFSDHPVGVLISHIITPSVHRRRTLWSWNVIRCWRRSVDENCQRKQHCATLIYTCRLFSRL